MMCDCLQPSDREEDWAGLCLANDEVLSAYELHEKFTQGEEEKEKEEEEEEEEKEEEENSGPIKPRTRLMTLCACSSGTVPRECDSRFCLSCQHRLVHFADDDAESRSRPSHARGSARLCPNCAGRRHSMSAGVQVERPRQGEHHSHDAGLCVYGTEQG